MKVKKKSNKPFKSTLYVNTVKGIVDHPNKNGTKAFTFEEDDSVVDIESCSVVDREPAKFEKEWLEACDKINETRNVLNRVRQEYINLINLNAKYRIGTYVRVMYDLDELNWEEPHEHIAKVLNVDYQQFSGFYYEVQIEETGSIIDCSEEDILGRCTTKWMRDHYNKEINK